MHFEARGNSGEKSLKKYSSVSLKGTQVGRINSRKLDEHKRAVSPETNTVPFAMPQLLEVYQYVQGNLFFCHGQSKLEGTMVNREPPQTMKLTCKKIIILIILI